MPRIPTLDPDQATGPARDLLEQVRAKMGRTPNIMKTMAQAPAVLAGYLGFSGALAGGSLSARLRERIALAVAEQNDCSYCVAAHGAIAKMTGLNDDEIRDAREGRATDRADDEALRFALRVIESRGFVTDEELQRMRDAGHDDAAILEIVGVVSLNIFTNLFNHVADTEVDFPAQPVLARD